jgi:MFS family permease
MFLAGLAVFTAASLGSGLAASGSALVVARAAQGIGAALLSPAALSIVTTTFHGPERNRALAVWAAIGGAGAAVGVVLGGALTSGPGWEWVFFINIPVGVAVAAALPAVVGSGAPGDGPRRIDLPGALAATIAVGLIIYGLVEAGDSGWADGVTLGALGGGAVLAVLFVLIERATPAPLVRPGLVARRPVAAGNLVMVAASGLLLSSFFLSSQYLQHVLELSALRTGLVFLPIAAALGAGTHLGARIVGRFGGRPAAAAGFALAAAGAVLLAQLRADGSAVVDVLPGFLIAGLGLGAAFVAATTTALAHVEPGEAGVGSGMINTGHELGGTLGVAFVSTVAGASLDAGVGGPVSVSGFGDAFLVMAAVAVVTTIVALVAVPRGRPPATDRPVFAH